MQNQGIKDIKSKQLTQASNFITLNKNNNKKTNKKYTATPLGLSNILVIEYSTENSID